MAGVGFGRPLIAGSSQGTIPQFILYTSWSVLKQDTETQIAPNVQAAILCVRVNDWV